MTDVHEQVSKSLKLVGRVLGEKFKLTACIGIGGQMRALEPGPARVT